MWPMAACTSVTAPRHRRATLPAPQLRRRSTSRTLGMAALLAGLLSCRSSGCDCPPPSDRPRSEHLLVAPEVLYALEGTEFIVRARHLDPDGGMQPIHGKALTWDVAGSLTLVSSEGDSAILRAHPVDALTTNAIRVQLDDRRRGTGTVTVVPDGASDAALDQVVARAEPYPNVALVAGYAKPGSGITINPSGTVTGVCKNSWIAFVGAGVAGRLTGDCPPIVERPDVTGEVTVLAPGYGVAQKAVAWSDLADRVDLSPTTSPRPTPIVVDYSVVLAAVGAEAVSVTAEIEIAKQIFAREATGLDLQGTIRDLTAYSASVIVASRNAPLECAGVASTLRDAGVPLGLDAKKLTVVYVDDILGPAYGGGESSYPSGLLGYSCPTHPTEGALIVISWRLRSPTTLAHELGHTLGLRDAAGHTNALRGFGYTNLMWAGQDPNRSHARSHLTLGQAFRMNFDAQSWVQRPMDGVTARPPKRICGPPDQSLPCPKLEWDDVTWPTR